jgi:hypothetical protein
MSKILSKNKNENPTTNRSNKLTYIPKEKLNRSQIMTTGAKALEILVIPRG